MHEVKCNLCSRSNFQTATIEMVFDAYCVSCRGLFNHLVSVKGFSAAKASKTIADTYNDKDLLPVGVYNFEGFTRTVIRKPKQAY